MVIPKILVVGQTPPPIGGQAVLISELLAASFSRVKLFHVRMAFSNDMKEVGRLRAGKVAHLGSVIARIVWMRFRHGTKVLYYPPAGNDRNPIFRDLIILGATRWLFKRTIFHFHACGVSASVKLLPQPLRWLSGLVYGAPDCAIVQSSVNPPDGFNLKAARNVLVPCGLKDSYPPYKEHQRKPSNPPVLLFVGRIGSLKGVPDLLESSLNLIKRRVPFRLELMGQFASPEDEQKILGFIDDNQMKDHVRFLGVLDGDEKWSAFLRADVFCFPSYYESFGLALLEAMQFSIPVVSTRWYGVPPETAANGHDYPLVDGHTGYLVDLGDTAAFSRRLEELLASPALRREMGKNGRQLYLRKYTLDRWLRDMEEIFYSSSQERMNYSSDTLELFPKRN